MGLRGNKMTVPSGDSSNIQHEYGDQQVTEGEVVPAHDTRGQNMDKNAGSDAGHNSNLAPHQTPGSQDKPRRKSWLKRWQDLTNPKAEFTDEYVKERTGMTKVELAEWLQNPENKKKAEKLWPSAVYWASIGG